ncbi:hypothetical protein [Foetidibacter luteolus]|uniref:hypothetical protein n=1 Tax=Foetidibacter luteolus TaxID=2608880 RepID=UPI00129A65C2|nr:hypothetical protein [Foetidibacter luteolus]
MQHITQDLTGTVPAQYTGTELRAEETVELSSPEEAVQVFQFARERLLNPGSWNNIAQGLSASFQLTNDTGDAIEGPAKKGNYLRIDIPGPGSDEGQGYDWVFIEELKEVNNDDEEQISLRVRPAANPNDHNDHIAHFYGDSATSNFIISRMHNRVSAIITDKNIKPNDDAESIAGKIRDKIVGLTAISAFSKIQWQGLAKGLLAGA